jgi:hypothetical protein
MTEEPTMESILRVIRDAYTRDAGEGGGLAAHGATECGNEKEQHNPSEQACRTARMNRPVEVLRPRRAFCADRIG